MRGSIGPAPAVSESTRPREDAWISSGPDRLAAWVYRPEAPAPYPCVVIAHGLDGVREQRLDTVAARFAAAGMAAVVFDYRHFGASEGEPRQLIDLDRQLADWRAAITFARGLDAVDPDRIALWGTSLSGGHVVGLAAEDRRIAAATVQLPVADGMAQLGFFPLGLTLRLLLAGLADQLLALVGRGPRRVPAAGPAGSTAVVTVPDALYDLERITPAPTNWRNELCARFTLRIGFYRPARKARHVACPLLVCMADADGLAAPGPPVAIAREAPRGRLHRYPTDHFGCYLEHFDELVADQTAFLRTHLGLAGP